jgi:hypothetical protein
MRHPLHPRLPSPATVVAFLALSAALAGTAVALPGEGSVKRDDIARNAIQSQHIANGGVTGADVRESSLASVPSAEAAPIRKLIYRQSQFTVGANGAFARGSVSCDPGFKATGGGVRTDDATTAGAGVRVQSAFPNGLDKWDAEVVNTGSTAATIRVWVVCATVAATDGEPAP